MHSDIFTYIDPSQPSTVAAGPLAAKSLAIQPNMSVRGWPTEAGSIALDRFVAVEDATVVKRLRTAGAKTMVSTRMSELGFGLAGDTAAQALAEGHADIALITDTMGEVRVAASTTGVFGFKPSYGTVSRFGLIGLVPSMECFGILAGKLEDIATVMVAISGSDDRDPSMPGFGPECELPDFSQVCEAKESIAVAGLVKEAVDGLGPSESEAFSAALSRLEKAGVKIQELSLPDFDLFRSVHNVIGSVEASSAGGKYDGVRYGHRSASAKNWNEMYLRSRGESFGLLVKTYMLQGAYFQFENYSAFEDACRIRARLVRKTEELFDKADLLVFPTRRPGFDAAAAGTINEVYDAFSLTLLANVTGMPALALPGLVFDGDVDPGLQLVGPRLSDARLLSVALCLAG
ncbi:MAG: hypothetical protein HWN68_05210 [Desulfobacterales bacterium]|nr:hypothetical protein [Desulfobacterales bacterium]